MVFAKLLHCLLDLLLCLFVTLVILCALTYVCGMVIIDFVIAFLFIASLVVYFACKILLTLTGAFLCMACVWLVHISHTPTRLTV